MGGMKEVEGMVRTAALDLREGERLPAGGPQGLDHLLQPQPLDLRRPARWDGRMKSRGLKVQEA